MKKYIAAFVLLFLFVMSVNADEPGDIYTVEKGHVFCIDYEVTKVIIEAQKHDQKKFIAGLNTALQLGACFIASEDFKVTLVEQEEMYVDFGRRLNVFWQVLYEPRDLILWIVLDGKVEGI